MKLLALDTATEACSAALLIDDEIHERFEITPRAHARLLLPMLDGLLAEAGLKPAQLDAIAFGRGPGSFTGVRIAASVAQGIAFAADLPVLPVSTLAALARDALQRNPAVQVFAAIDARMGEIYWAAYAPDAPDTSGAQGEPRALTEEQVTPALAVTVPAGTDWFGIGTGWGEYEQALRAHFAATLRGIDATALPRAVHIARLAALDFAAGRAVAAEQAQPVYLRNQVAHKPAGR
ncbi:MAG: tRNA (adenosine(37)-N6)-threonylcarbamoyltransferase complex dimerization subunit type 1 TsaB [Gammaproteobacteria bacterium]|nr:tRNA (adenosine(37)-N6)-threonylcarbamoyltransferase complex dimerization subunit type 1 TsaB [Gammaproteobacteria bacterium]